MFFANLAVSPQQSLIFRAGAVLSIKARNLRGAHCDLPSLVPWMRVDVFDFVLGEAMDKADFTMEDLKDPERLKFLLMK